MAGGEIPINPENFEEVLEKINKEKKVDVKRIKRKGENKDSNDEAALELAEQKVRLEKLEKKRGGRKFETETKEMKEAANVGIGGVNKNDSEGGETKDLRQKENELVEKIQEMTREGKTFEEKKGVIDQLVTIRENRDKRKETMQGKEEANRKPEILEHFGGDYVEIMKNDKQKSGEGIIKGEYADNLEARQEMEELAKQPSPELKQEFLEKNEEYINTEEEKEKKNIQGISEARERLIYEQGGKISNLEAENLQLKENLENAKKVESKLAAMESEANKQIEQSKNPTLKESIKKYLKDPKVKTAIVFGLVGAGIYTASGGTAPIYFALKAALGYKSLFIPAYIGHGFSTWGTAAAIGGLIGHAAEKLGLMKGEKSDREKGQEAVEKIKKAGSEQRPAAETAIKVKSEEPQIIEEKTEGKKEGFFSKIFGKRGEAKKEEPEEFSVFRKYDEIDNSRNASEFMADIVYSDKEKNYSEKYKKYLATKENPEAFKIVLINSLYSSLKEGSFGDDTIKGGMEKAIQFLYPEKSEEEIKEFCHQSIRYEIYQLLYPESEEKTSIEQKSAGVLIKKPEKMKKPAPEMEDKFDKKAEDVKIFVEQLKEGKKTGKEIFEYLENLRHQFLYTDNPDKTNFNSKIRPELDKLSKKEKTDMIDLVVEYAMSREKEFLEAPLGYDLDDIVYGKDFAKHNYVIRGKTKNVEWLYGYGKNS